MKPTEEKSGWRRNYGRDSSCGNKKPSASHRRPGGRERINKRCRCSAADLEPQIRKNKLARRVRTKITAITQLGAPCDSLPLKKKQGAPAMESSGHPEKRFERKKTLPSMFVQDPTQGL